MAGTSQLWRVARRLFWTKPVLYSPFGILRGRGNVFDSNHQLYISGYPRSGNTFAVKAFLLANPGTRLRSHTHIPPFVVRSARRNMPGMVLIRNPFDATVSWAIYMQQPLRETLAYYIDYYRTLLPYREDLFFVSFESVTGDFGRVMDQFNARWGTYYVPFQHTDENVALCMAEIEAESLGRDGDVVESRVSRPSAERKQLKENLLRRLNSSPFLQKELFRANELYQTLAPRNFIAKKTAGKTSATQMIRLRPAI